jgi:hypothetical protein
MNQQLDKVR